MSRSETSGRYVPRLGICQNSLCNLGMAGDLEMLAEIGADSISPMGSLLRPFGVDEMLRAMNRLGLVTGAYHANLRLVEMTDEDAAEALDLNLAIASRLGATIMSVSPGPSGDLSTAEADRSFIARLAQAAPRAQSLGVTMVVEPLHPLLRANGYIHSLSHAIDIVSRVRGCAIMLDLVQLYWDRALTQDIALHADQIGVVQLGNLGIPALREKRWERSPLADGAVDVEALIRALDDAGYRGAYELENPTLREPAECAAAIRAERRWFDALWEAGNRAEI